MPCKDALTTKVVTLSPTHTVEKALAEMKKAKAVFAPVVEDGALVGVFSFSRLLTAALPVSVALGLEGGGSSVRIPTAPGLGRRLQRAMGGTVAELMDRHVMAVALDAPLQAAIRHLATRAEPVCVAEADGTFRGVVTEEGILAALEKDGGLE